jgi:hypothetical protein
MLPWMCGRQTLTIVVSSPCMTQAQMTVAVVIPRCGTGGALSPLTARTAARPGRRSSAAPGRLSYHRHILYTQPSPLVAAALNS